jgi:rfaE bifunctional protein kinase chain/domain
MSKPTRPKKQPPAPPRWLEDCLRACEIASVTVVGDFCLDAYWTVDPGPRGTSLETGRPVNRVVAQEYSAGGAGNVAMNLRAIGVPKVRAVGFVGRDVFGGAVRGLLDKAGISTKGLVTRSDWTTPVYAKPHLRGEEQERYDFGSANLLTEEAALVLAHQIDAAASLSTAVVINQQLAGSLVCAGFLETLNSLIRSHPGVSWIVDSRNHATGISGAILKVNASEAASLCGDPQEGAGQHAPRHALRLAELTRRPVFVTRGAQGIVAAGGARVAEVAAYPLSGPIDPVGAGDTVVAALAASLGRGCASLQAAQFANLAAAVTVRKLRTTGTASPDEMRSLAVQHAAAGVRRKARR